MVNGVATDFVTDACMFVRELSGGSSKATYFMGASGPAYRRDDVTSGIRWYLYDGLGSVLGEVAPDGSITATRKYDVYGAVRSSTGTSTSKHKFVGALGHPSEDETNLTYMQARYYDPQTGRFISQDPAKNGSNWFNYCHSNPVNKVDCSGRVDEEIKLLIRFFNERFCALIEEWFQCIQNANKWKAAAADARELSNAMQKQLDAGDLADPNAALTVRDLAGAAYLNAKGMEGYYRLQAVEIRTEMMALFLDYADDVGIADPIGDALTLFQGM